MKIDFPDFFRFGILFWKVLLIWGFFQFFLKCQIVDLNFTIITFFVIPLDVFFLSLMLTKQVINWLEILQHIFDDMDEKMMKPWNG